MRTMYTGPIRPRKFGLESACRTARLTRMEFQAAMDDVNATGMTGEAGAAVMLALVLFELLEEVRSRPTAPAKEG